MAGYSQLPADWAATTGVTQVLNKPTLSVVSATGSYVYLLNVPLISTAGHSGLYSRTAYTVSGGHLWKVQRYACFGSSSDSWHASLTAVTNGTCTIKVSHRPTQRCGQELLSPHKG